MIWQQKIMNIGKSFLIYAAVYIKLSTNCDSVNTQAFTSSSILK